MTSINPSNNLRDSLLGRLKLILFSKITGQAEQIPSKQQLNEYFFQIQQENTALGDLYFSLLGLGKYQRIFYNSLPEDINIANLLTELESEYRTEDYFIELNECPPELPGIIGILITCHRLIDEGLVYVLTALSEDNFPSMIRVEVRASQRQPDPVISVATSNGYEYFDTENYISDATITILIRVLVLYQQHTKKTYLVDPKSLGENERLRPPHDDLLKDLIVEVLQGDRTCAQGLIRSSLIKPFSLDFCLDYPFEMIDMAERGIKKGEVHHILVYWNGQHFITSDDYMYYLAYRKMGGIEIPVTILGDYPPELAQVHKIGGEELISPAIAFHFPRLETPLSNEEKEKALDKRLQIARTDNNTLTKLYSIFTGLSRLIQNPKTKEREIHNFLLANPIALDPNSVVVMSEVRLGTQYRIDLAIQYTLNNKRVQLIELERATYSIFTKEGRLRAEVNHSIQQVEDWLRWWQENPSNVPSPLDSSITPEGLVVMGRSNTMDTETRRRLWHLNFNRRVKLITYDDLLAQIRGLIMQLEQLNSL